MKKARGKFIRNRALSILLIVTMLFSSVDLTAFATETVLEAEETQNPEDSGTSHEYGIEDNSGETNHSEDSDTSEDTGSLDEVNSSGEVEKADRFDNSDESSSTGETGESENTDETEITEDTNSEEAVDISENGKIESSNLTIESTNSFGRLLAETLQSEQIEELENTGCNIFSIILNDTQAVVSFQTVVDATLVVGVYEEDGVKQLATGYTQVLAGDTEAVVDIATESLPEYFYLKAYLVDTKSFRPYCEVYESDDYTRKMQEFYAKTTDNFDSEQIINLDEDISNNFIVFDESVIVIERSDDTDINKVIECDEENLIYQIQNPDGKFRSLEEGDIFAYYYDDNEAMITKIKSVISETDDDSTILIIQGEDPDFNAIIDFIKVGAKNPKDIQTISYDLYVTEEDSKKWKLPDWSNDDDADISVDISDIGGESIVRVYRDSDKDIYKSDLEITYGAKVKVSATLIDIEKRWKLGEPTMPTNVPGLTLSCKIEIKIEFEGSVNVQGSISGSIGFSADKNGKVSKIVKDPVFVVTYGSEAAVKVGFVFTPMLKFLHEKIMSVSLEIDFGLKLTIFRNDILYANLERHACQNCYEITFGPYLTITGIVQLLLGKEDIKLVDKDWTPAEAYYSLDKNEFRWGQCPYKEYKVTIVIKSDKNSAVTGLPIAGVKVIVNSEEGVTDKNGKLDMWMPEGMNTFHLYYGGKRICSTFEGIHESKKVYIELYVRSSSLEVKEAGIASNTSYAVTTDGGLYMWGNNYEGWVGNGSTKNNQTIPYNVLDNILELGEMYSDFSGALTWYTITTDGSLYMWGDNDYGQVGNGNTDNQTTPYKVLDNVRETGGDYTRYAITIDGSLYMWGDNNAGRVGNGKRFTKQLIPYKVMDDVREAGYDGYYAGYAITTDGSLYEWGSDFADQNAPYKVMDNVREVVDGSNKYVITTDGSLYSWKIDYTEYVENEIINKQMVIYKELILDNVREAGAGYAITTDGSLYMWGSNFAGQVGNGNTDNQTTPYKVLDNVRETGGDLTRYAITTDGSLYMWGVNGCGQVGNGSTDNQTTPYKVLDNVKETGANYDGHTDITSYAITTDGSLYMWGSNGAGTVGNGSTDEYYQFIPYRVMDNVREAGVDSYTSYAITTDESLYMWGVNDYGQVGNGSSYEYQCTPYKVTDNIKEAGVNDSTSYAITTDGKLYMWGRNGSGQIGNGSDSSGVRYPYEVQFLDISPVDDSDSSGRSESLDSMEIYDVEFYSDSLYTVNEAGNTSDNKATFSNLVPNDIFNIYIMKFKTAENPLSSDNLLCITQTIYDENGNLNVAYGMTQDYENPIVFCVGFSQIDLSSAEFTVPDIVYDGDEHYPEATVILNGQQLVEGTDYEIHGNCSLVDVGEYKIVIKGIGTYCGEIETTFRIKEGSGGDTGDGDDGEDNGDKDQSGNGDVLPDDIPADGIIPEGLWISFAENDGIYDYTGSAIKPIVRVYDHKTLLKEKTDYTIAYKNNTKAYEVKAINDQNTISNTSSIDKNAPTITVTGKGNYLGKETVNFSILQLDISDTEIFGADDISLAYNGKAQKPIPTLLWNGKKLKNNMDYTFTYSDNTGKKLDSVKDVAKYAIELSGKGNFTGTRKLNLSVINTENFKLISKVSVSKIPNQSYRSYSNGVVIPSGITVKDGKTFLTENVHYQLSYSNNTKVGTGYVIIKGIEEGGYSGTKRVSFKITGTPISKASINGLTSTFTYGGVNIKPELKLSLNVNSANVDLEEDTDYKISWQNNYNKGSATVIITGKGGYTGTLKKKFKIKAFDIAANQDNRFTVYMENTSVPYAKGGAKPKLTVTFRNDEGKIQTLKEGSDYTLKYKNNTAITNGSNTGKQPMVIVKGKGNFTGTYAENLNYTIVVQDLVNLSLIAQDKTYRNKKNIYTTKITLTDIDGKVLKAGKDYDKALKYTYKDNTTLDSGIFRTAGTEVSKDDIIPAGTVIIVTASAATSTVSKPANYTGNCSGEYSIKEFNISGAKITINKQEYSGKKITLDKSQISVKVKGKEIPTDQYEIVEDSYKNNVKKGTASVTIKGVDNYGGTKTVKFKIKAKGFLWWWRK